jgi:hypothetical protein
MIVKLQQGAKEEIEVEAGIEVDGNRREKAPGTRQNKTSTRQIIELEQKQMFHQDQRMCWRCEQEEAQR